MHRRGTNVCTPHTASPYVFAARLCQVRQGCSACAERQLALHVCALSPRRDCQANSTPSGKDPDQTRQCRGGNAAVKRSWSPCAHAVTTRCT